ncbi:ester cyclase [Zhihengliuella salsuginis]|uniref:SnoaL-like polyketide cyclase n=1 Tax=Zhihengliuella salsuginis TaxID=578222 RepID=A0ABQ3GGC4_9MICC|nr:ester cyclase [Zhihengliuella salsuginis]GHD03924.1 hypothetical protein GCM10008096_10610 [Zhihengliuella salsuginis]
MSPREATAPEGWRWVMKWLLGVFPDMRWEIHHLVADGEMVPLNCTFHGTHSGELNGVPATGREVAISYARFMRFEDGLLREFWGVRDDAALMRQLTEE